MNMEKIKKEVPFYDAYTKIAGGEAEYHQKKVKSADVNDVNEVLSTGKEYRSAIKYAKRAVKSYNKFEPKAMNVLNSEVNEASAALKSVEEEIKRINNELPKYEENMKNALDAYMNGNGTFDNISSANSIYNSALKRLKELENEKKELEARIKEADGLLDALKRIERPNLPQYKSLGERIREAFANATKRMSNAFGRLSDWVADHAPTIAGATVLAGAAAIFTVAVTMAAPAMLIVGGVVAAIGIGELLYAHAIDKDSNYSFTQSMRAFLGNVELGASEIFGGLSKYFRRKKIIQTTLDEYE